MKNADKNANNNPIPNNVPFSKDRQPAPELKKKGWERKQQAQQIMDKMLEFKDMTLQEFQAFQDDIKANPDKHTVIELKLAQYISEKKNTIDFLDRHISKAPIQQEVSGANGEALSIKFVLEGSRDPEILDKA